MSDRRPSTLLKDLLVSAAVAVAVFGAVQWWLDRGSHHDQLDVGEPPPPLVLRDMISGETVDVPALRGRPSIVSFWAAWCRPCLEELPDLQRLHSAGTRQLNVITVTADDPLAVRRLFSTRGYTLPCLLDATGEVSARYGVDHLPRTLVLDPEGRVAHDLVGPVDLTVLRSLVARWM